MTLARYNPPMPSLDDYLRQLASLKRAPLADSPLTFDRYPNKPLLLLAILDLIGSGHFAGNRLYLCPEVTEGFDRYWDLAAPRVTPRNIRIPFEKLQSSSFWHLTQDRHPFTRVRIAQLDRELFAFATKAEARAVMRRVLIQAHFAPEIQPALLEAGQTSEEAFVYSGNQLHDIIRDAAPAKIRSQAFRVTVVRAYDYRCAICGIRIFSHDGRTAVEAAHIEPWAIGYDDTPTNGISLCRLCHWTFDAGLLAVTGAYTIITSPRLTHETNLGGHLATTAQRPIFVPDSDALKPDPRKLEWHRKHIFTR
jgi:putative restriction endonuclease